MNIQDEVETELGRARVVGLMDSGTLVEVRYPGSRALRVWPRERVKLVMDHETEQDIPLAKAGDVIEFQTTETVPIEDVPLSSTGRPLSGAALKKYLAKKERERG